MAEMSTPNSWRRVWWGLGVFLATGAVCGVLTWQFVIMHPLDDLRDRSSTLIVAIEQQLLLHGVPKDRLKRGPVEMHADGKAVWRWCAFDVDLPPAMNREDTVRLFREIMIKKYGVTVAVTPSKSSVATMRFSVQGHEFCMLKLTQSLPPPPPLEDRTAASLEIADKLDVWLKSRVARPEAVARRAPEAMEDDRAKWTLTRFDVAEEPPIVAEEELVAALNQELAPLEAVVRPRIALRGTVALAAFLGECRCVEITFLRQGTLGKIALRSQKGDRVSIAYESPPGEVESLPAPRRLNGSIPEGVAPVTTNVEEVPLDSTGLEDIELGKRLTGVKTITVGNPRVAIIVDDGGYGGGSTDRILALDPKLTLAILPYTPFARETFDRARALGFELMVHVPMDARAHMAGALEVGQTCEEIAARLGKALAEFPGAVGVNNHMGSGFTSDADAVNCLMNALKSTNYYFIDSRTGPRTKAYDTAKSLGIRTASRDVFLDNEKNFEYIKGQFKHLLDVAKEQGQAVAICHFRDVTAEALVKLLPELKENGIDLVRASELVQ